MDSDSFSLNRDSTPMDSDSFSLNHDSTPMDGDSTELNRMSSVGAEVKLDPLRKALEVLSQPLSEEELAEAKLEVERAKARLRALGEQV